MPRSLLPLFILFLASLTAPAQKEKIYTKDGKLLGDRKAFIEGCQEGIKEDSMRFKGFEVDVKDYCGCICDSLMPRLTSQEIMEANKKDEFRSVLTEKGNFKVLMGCLTEHFEGKHDSDRFRGFGAAGYRSFKKLISSDIDDKTKKIAKDSCIKTLQKQNPKLWDSASARTYCSCAIGKVIEKDLSFSQLQKLQDPSSESFEKIVIPCMQASFQKAGKEKREKKGKIIGDRDSSVVTLIEKVNGTFAVKMRVGDSSDLFMFDTGASRLIISEKMERELLANGSLDPDKDYLGKAEFTLANGKKVQADLVRLESVSIGDYKVKNVKAGVLEGASPLCGKGFLDRFRKWELDQSKKELILYK